MRDAAALRVCVQPNIATAIWPCAVLSLITGGATAVQHVTGDV
jgi:hypothetical protein